jgi:hypothetical protein
MMESTYTPQFSSNTDSSTRPAVRLPHRWWATPGYAVSFDGKERSVRRPRSAQIRVHAVAGVPNARKAGA